MAKTASEIVDRALSLIDEVVTDFNTAASTETSIREQALELLPEVCRDLVKELPWELKRYLSISASLTPDTPPSGEFQTSLYKQKIMFVAPTDFWELESIQLTVWAKRVTDYIYIGSKEYQKQNNPFTRNGKQNPVVAINGTATGGNARIECFSINTGDASTVNDFRYISFDNVPDDVGNSWPDELFDEVTKALSIQLMIIKGNMEGAGVKSEEISNKLQQFE